MKKFIMMSFALLLVLTFTGCFNKKEKTDSFNNEELISSIEDNNEQEEIIEEVNDDDTKETIKNEESKVVEDNITTNDNNKNNSNTTKKKKNNNTKKETTTPVVKNEEKNIKQQEVVKENPKIEQKSESGEINEKGNTVDTKKEVYVDNEPWVKTGVSKEDYYTKPVNSWMRVDYPIGTCGSISSCESICLEKAKELSFTENLSCVQVYTYSGDYLGEMLKKN